MTEVSFIDAAALSRLVPMADAIDALHALFAAGSADAPPRTHVATPDGDLLLMPAASPDGVGVKLVTVTPRNPGRRRPLIHGLYVLFAPTTQTPVAIVDGAALTALRTAAVSGLATRLLARDDARDLVVFGAGTQARAHVRAVCTVRDIARVTIVSRTRASAAALVTDLRRADGPHEGAELEVGDPDVVATADVVCTCTTSDTPVFDGTRLRPGAHVNAVGAYKPTARELDATTMRRGRVVVEDRDAARAEAGDLAIPLASGQLSEPAIAADLADAVGGAEVRRTRDDITVFKSVGLASEDLAIAHAAVRRHVGA